jgi:hypothetical protein
MWANNCYCQGRSPRKPLGALLLTSTQQKKIVRRTARRDFALFALDIAGVAHSAAALFPAVFCLLSET